MSESIQCEVQQIDAVNNYGKIKVHLLASEENEKVKTSAGYNTETDVFYINWKQEDDIPHWLKQGNKIDMPFNLFKGYVTFDRFSNRGVKVLEESKSNNNTSDDIPDDDLDDSFDTEKLEAESKSETFGDINIKVVDMIAKYRMCLKAINEDEYLGKLDNGLKKDIATSFFIQLNR